MAVTRSRKMANGRNGSSSLRLDWQNLIITVGLLIVIVGGFWQLAILPVQNAMHDLRDQVTELRTNEAKHFMDDDNKFLTQKEHGEFKNNVHAQDIRSTADLKELNREVETLKRDVISRADAQALLNTTRLEFLSEIKRLDQLVHNHMDRKEFDVWKSERDKVIAIIQDRQNRLSEALDSMYSKLMQQIPSYQQKQ